MTTHSINALSQPSSSKGEALLGRTSSNSHGPTSATNHSAAHLGGRKTATLGQPRQTTTTDIMTGEDLVRTTGSDYQEIQKRTLTKWVNAQLQVEGDRINNIETDFKDGRKLLKLLSVVSKDSAPKPEKMNMRIHQLANVAQALSFLEKRVGADSIVDVGNEAIVNGDKKKTLALIFFIMTKYQIQAVINDHGDDFAQALLVYSDRHYDGLTTLPLASIPPPPPPPLSMNKQLVPGNNSLVSARKHGSHHSLNPDKQHSNSMEAKLALLFWVRIQLEDYIVANIIPNIPDFSRSWRNGLAFCLLIHRHEPDFIPDLFSYHLKDIDMTQKQTWHRLLTLAFDLATKHMRIPRYLESEDLVDVDYPHEPSIMMYVAEFYKVMSLAQQNMTLDERLQTAVRRRTAAGVEINTLLTSPSNDLQHTNLDNDKGTIDNHSGNTDIGTSSSDTARQQRKKAHRRSTLAEEDKIRIKADLNNRLLMQLTGHLPRGVHPFLDQLLTIYDDLLNFIERSTRIVDNVPTSFDSADSVTEHSDALQLVGGQMDEKAPLLDAARDIKDMLMQPPENVDDSLIRLTELQQAQVKNLYDTLMNQWTDFGQLMTTTRRDLMRMESDLANIEENTQKYHTEADKVMDRLKELHRLLAQVIPRHPDNIDIEWHPLDDNDHMGEIADTYRKSAEIAKDQADLFDSTTWKHYRRFILQFSRVVMKRVKPRSDELEQDHQCLMDASREVISASRNFSCALDLISTTRHIACEIECIDKLVESDTPILDLVNRVNIVRIQLHNTWDAYDYLWANDERLATYVNKVQQQYETVYDRVNQAHMWFTGKGRLQVNDRIKQLQGSIKALQADINGVDPMLLSDAHIMEWQKHIDTLDKNNYAGILRVINSLARNRIDPSSPFSHSQDQQQQLDQVAEAILSIRNTLTSMYDVVTLKGLFELYKDKAKVTETKIQITLKALQEIQQQLSGLGNSTADVQLCYNSLFGAYQEVTQTTMVDCKETYNNLGAYNSFIERIQKGTDKICDPLLLEMATLRSTIEANWNLLQTQEQLVSRMMSMALQLVGGYGLLEKVESNAQAIRVNMKDGPTDLEAATSLEHLIYTQTTTYMNDAKAILDTLDGENALDFGKRFSQVVGMVSELGQELTQHKKRLEKNKLLESLGEQVIKLQMDCQEQLKMVRQYTLTSPALSGKRPESINRLFLQPHVTTLMGIESALERCKNDFKGVLDQSQHLVNGYGVPLAHLESLTRPVHKNIQESETAIQTEKEYIEALKFVIKHGKAEVELTRSLTAMKTTLSQYTKQGIRTRLNQLPDYMEFNRLHQDLENSIQLFFLMGEDFKKAKQHKNIGPARFTSVNKAIDYYQKSIRRTWVEIKNMVNEAKPLLDELNRRQHGTSKLNEALLYVDAIKSRISTLQLSGMTKETDELDEIDKEIKVTLAKKLQEMDVLLESISDSDGIIRKQRAQLSTTTDQLYHLLQVRQEQTQTQGNITLFLDIIDQVDALVLQVLVEVEKAAPHHAKILNGKYVKNELQELLRRLVGVYKKNGPQINKLLGSAKAEARKQFLDDNDLVAKRLKKTMGRWTKAQMSAATREKELHAYINTMDHEFFSKLAATTKRKTPTINNNRRSSHPSDRSSTPGTDSSSPSSSTSLGRLAPPIGYTTTRRTSFQSSTVSVDQRMAGVTPKRPKTPTPTGGRSRTAYVPDPKNELDVQLGRIVNDSTYKVNVKSVSDEVGKYYFGERLVYCRILPSKMVMVRVGGGWVELSSFLKGKT
ncbi:hypothetical protein BC941DRAFT_80866 [Chlamydoabsidia padenii]|nr:hypothetical protein BC941DRAFT_80866 [Chlamydoabsidia padenii]